jgi:coproporphyrinogen III oxidase
MPTRLAGQPAADDVRRWLVDLQQRIVERLESLDGGHFQIDDWSRPTGGGGRSRVIEDSEVFERGGVLFSHVAGAELPAAASATRPGIAGRPYEAMGVSLVLHPRNPHVPTVHMNVRFFVAHAVGDAAATWWFGGGMDLTPYYTTDADVIHFHRVCRDALAPFGPQWHPRFKRWCDEYFFVRHRQEARGVGGLFFDDLNEPDFATAFALTRSVGEAFCDAYAPIVERNHERPWNEAQRQFQLYRRGRYVEFNLVYDRGTLFGLQSGGRTESILVSMPPLARWAYDWTPDPGSPEAALTERYLVPREWV